MIQDARAANGGLDHRGHVVALSLFCAVDMASAYAYQTDRVGARYRRFIESHFPTEYRVHAAELYRNYRNSTVHSWHLFKASILPDRQPIEVQGGTLVFGLLHFFEALETAIEHFLVEAQHDAEVQAAVLARYAKLRASARS